MIMTLTEADFIELTNRFRTLKDNFSYEGKKALFNYLEEYEEDTSDTIEFDYIALCCDYSEYDNLEDLLSEYSASSLENLKENTEVIEFVKWDRATGIFKAKEYKSYIIRNF